MDWFTSSYKELAEDQISRKAWLLPQSGDRISTWSLCLLLGRIKHEVDLKHRRKAFIFHIRELDCAICLLLAPYDKCIWQGQLTQNKQRGLPHIQSEEWSSLGGSESGTLGKCPLSDFLCRQEASNCYYYSNSSPNQPSPDLPIHDADVCQPLLRCKSKGW